MLRTALGASIGWLGISMIADGVPTLLLPHRLVSDGRSDATTLGLTTLVAIALAAALQPAAGRWSDRIGRFPVIAVGSAGAVAGLALLLLPGMGVAGTVLALAGVSLAQAGHQALLPDRVSSAWRGRAGGMKSALDVGGAFLGFVVLAALLGAGQPALAVAALAAVLVGSFVAARALLGRHAGRAASTAPLGAAYLVDLAAHRPLVTLVLARFLFLLGIYVVGRFLFLFVVERLGVGAAAAAEAAGMALALLAGVTVLASLPSGWLADRLGRRPVMLAGGLLAAVGIALLPLATDTMAVLAFGSLMALGSAAFGAGSWAMLADLVEPTDAGRQLGLAHVGTAVAAALAGAFGAIVDASGFGLTFALAAACSLAGGIVAWGLADAERSSEPLAGSAGGTA
jgi:MFS family permease